MPQNKPKDQKETPLPVLHAKTALEILAGEDAVLAQSVEKLLPGYALRLEKSGDDVTPEILLDAARQGAGFLKSSSALQKQTTSHDTITAYKKIAATLPTSRDNTPVNNLIDACKNGDEEKVSTLLGPHHNINGNVFLAIRHAAENGHIAILRLLFEHGADIKGDNGVAFLHAATKGQTGALRLMIEHEPSIIDSYGRGALVQAAGKGHNDTVRTLIEEGVKPGDVPDALATAAKKGLNDTIHLLIRHGCKISVSALSCAVEGGHIDTVRLLIAHGANIHAHDNEPFRTALRHGHTNIMQMLIESGVKLSTRLVSQTLLSSRHHNDAMRLLLEHGFHLLSTEQLNETLSECALSGRLDNVRMLVDEYKADVCSNNNKPLRWAADNENTQVIQFLIERGADVTAKDNAPLRVSIERRRCDNAELLIRNGANIKALPVEYQERYAAQKKDLQKWQRIVRMNPPKGLEKENPSLFKKGCFDAVVQILTQEDYYGDDRINLMAFHTAALFQTEQRLLQYLQQWGKAGKQPLHDLIYQIKLPAEGTPNLKDWGDAVLKCGPSMAKLVKFSDRIPSPMKSSDGKTWSMLNTRTECARFSFNRAAEYPALADLCFKHDVDEEDFNKALKLARKFPSKKNIPDISINGKKFNAEGYRFYRLPANDIRGLFLGEMTDCCQSIGSAGEHCAKHGYTSENSGFYVVENAKGKIVAQTWAWRGKKDEMCFDSLETLGDHVTPAQWTRILHETACELSTRKDHNVTALHVGKGGKTPASHLQQIFTQSATAAPKDYSKYRDSKGNQIVVWKK